jgi:Trp operon repressor
VAVGQVPATVSKSMSENQSVNKQKLEQIIKLLKFILTIDDMEIIKSTLESVVEILEEENNQTP